MNTRFRAHHLALAVLLAVSIKVFHVFPRSVAFTTATAGWWVLLLSGILAVLFLWLPVSHIARSEGECLITMAQKAGGPLLAIPVALLLGAVLLADSGLGIRQVSEAASTMLFPHTPQAFVMTGTAIAAAVAAAMSTGGLVWLASGFGIMGVLTILLILPGNLTCCLQWLVPVSGHGWLHSLAWAPPLTSSYAEAIFLLVAARGVADRSRLPAALGAVIMISALVMAGVQVAYGLVFPYPGGLGIPFPIFDMTRLIIGGRFLERVEMGWTFTWVAGLTLRTAVMLHGVALAYTRAFSLPDHRGAVLPLLMVSVATALLPSNVATAMQWQRAIEVWMGTFAAILMPLLVFAWLKVRQRRARGGLNRAG